MVLKELPDTFSIIDAELVSFLDPFSHQGVKISCMIVLIQFLDVIHWKHDWYVLEVKSGIFAKQRL